MTGSSSPSELEHETNPKYGDEVTAPPENTAGDSPSKRTRTPSPAAISTPTPGISVTPDTATPISPSPKLSPNDSRAESSLL